MAKNSVTLWLLVDVSQAPLALESYSNVDHAVERVLQMWNEEPEGPQCFLVTDDSGSVLATMTRDREDSEIAHVVYFVGDGSPRVCSFRCHYNLDAEGGYESTTISTLLN